MKKFVIDLLKDTCIAFVVSVIVIGTPLLMFYIYNEGYRPEDRYQQVLNISKSNVQLNIFSNEGHGVCSGTIIHNELDQAIISTAKHCTEHGENIYVGMDKVDKIYKSEKYDVALLIINHYLKDKEAVGLPQRYSKIYEKIYYVGSPGFLYYTQGSIIFKAKDYYISTLSIFGGCSGGGVFNDNGELIGVISWSTPLAQDGTSIAGFVPIEHTLNLIYESGFELKPNLR